MKLGRLGVPFAVCVLLAVPVAPAQADPGAAPIDHAADVIAPGAQATIDSAPAATTVAPDGWTLTVGAKDEVLRNVAPLTTALSSRD